MSTPPGGPCGAEGERSLAVPAGGADGSGGGGGSSSSSGGGTSSRSKSKRSTPGKGRWTIEEHQLFLEGLRTHGLDWTAISKLVKTRTAVQTRTHHQKFDQQNRKGRSFPEEVDALDGTFSWYRTQFLHV